jgi:hypothetical protein
LGSARSYGSRYAGSIPKLFFNTVSGKEFRTSATA